MIEAVDWGNKQLSIQGHSLSHWISENGSLQVGIS